MLTFRASSAGAEVTACEVRLSLALTHTHLGQESGVQAITQPPSSSSREPGVSHSFDWLRLAAIARHPQSWKARFSGSCTAPVDCIAMTSADALDSAARTGRGVGHDPHNLRSRLGIGPGKAGATPQPHCPAGVSHAGTDKALVPWLFLAVSRGFWHSRPARAPDTTRPSPVGRERNANDVTATPHLHHPTADLGKPSVDSGLSHLQCSILIVTFLPTYRIYYATLLVFFAPCLLSLALAGLAG